MPLAFQIAGQPADPLPSWRDPRYTDAPAVGMTPESIWNQAVSEYQWRLQHPHLDVWGRPMAEDTQEALERTILEPARTAVGLPQPESPWSGPIETAVGGIYQVNKATGAMRVIKPAGEVLPAATGLTSIGKARLSGEQWRRTAENLPPGPQRDRAMNESVAAFEEAGRLAREQEKKLEEKPEKPEKPPMETVVSGITESGQPYGHISIPQPAGTWAREHGTNAPLPSVLSQPIQPPLSY